MDGIADVKKRDVEDVAHLVETRSASTAHGEHAPADGARAARWTKWLVIATLGLAAITVLVTLLG